MTYHDDISDKGFTVIRQFLSPHELTHYYGCSQRVIRYARDGHWSQVRTLGKQFPPWPQGYNPDIWGVSLLLHPDLNEQLFTRDSPFHSLYADDKLLSVVRDILQCSNEEISMELLNMLINPLSDFELDWHRDTIKPDVSASEELSQLLQNPYAGTQFNLALTNDDCLIVVPGSHKRIRTDKERDITIHAPKAFIEDQITVHLNPGDIVFYNSNILHRAKYDHSQERITLHGSYGHSKYGESRALGVLQHGVGDWINEFDTVGDRDLEVMKLNLLKIAEGHRGEVRYALDG